MLLHNLIVKQRPKPSENILHRCLAGFRTQNYYGCNRLLFILRHFCLQVKRSFNYFVAKNTTAPIATPKNAPATTSMGVWPRAVRGGTSVLLFARLISAWIDAPCSPTERRTFTASYPTISNRSVASPNIPDWTPSLSPINTHTAVVVAVCELGIPPERKSCCVKSTFRPL